MPCNVSDAEKEYYEKKQAKEEFENKLTYRQKFYSLWDHHIEMEQHYEKLIDIINNTKEHEDILKRSDSWKLPRIFKIKPWKYSGFVNEE